MKFELVFTDHADQQMDNLEKNNSKKATLKAVRKILGFMEKNFLSPSVT
jgi:hypothetical protein